MIIVGISGASGPILGIRLVEELLAAGEPVTVIVSAAARQIIEYEIMEQKAAYIGLAEILTARNQAFDRTRLTEHDNSDFFAPIASGSTVFEAVAVVPCSMKTLSAIVHGYADSLICRTCDVALKERRQCLIVPRETPLNKVHTRNLYRAACAGIDILPPMPGFYTRPESVDDVVNFIVGKILNLLGRSHHLFASWGGESDGGC